MLSVQEKEDLYAVIVATFGEDAAFRIRKMHFNEQTSQIVEQAIQEEAKCNASMQELLGDLLGGGSVFVKGWLKRALNTFAKELRRNKNIVKGYGCRLSTKIRWKSPIMVTTY